MKVLKCCPKLIGSEVHEPLMIGHGAITVPILYPCMGEKCAAFSSTSDGDYCSAFGVCRRIDYEIEEKDSEKHQDSIIKKLIM